MANNHPAFPIQVRVAKRGEDGQFADEKNEQVWSSHKKHDKNAIRSFKEAIRDNPTALVRIHDIVNNEDLDAYAPDDNENVTPGN